MRFTGARQCGVLPRRAAGPAPRGIDFDAAIRALWNRTTGEPGIRIAILDGPVDRNHPTLRNAYLRSTPGVVPRSTIGGASSRHGTHVASIVFGDHSGPVAGVAPHCAGVSIPIFHDGPNGSIIPCSQNQLAEAIHAALAADCRIINISAGQFSQSGRAVASLVNAVRECRRRGSLIVAAAGNNGCECLHVPGALPSVLVVGAMNAAGEPQPFSNWGRSYRSHGILAPGVDIAGAVPGGGTTRQSGTSFATPIVSGVAALLFSLQRRNKRELDVNGVREALLSSALGCDFLQVPDCRRLLVGRLNVSGAVLQLMKGQGTMITSATSNDQQTGAVSEAACQCETADPTKAAPSSTGHGSIAVSSSEGTAVVPANYGGSDEPPPNPEEDDGENAPSRISHVAAASRPPANGAALPASNPAPTATVIVERNRVTPMMFPSACGCDGGSPPQLAYALGDLWFDFGTEARRDSLSQAAAAWANEQGIAGNEYPVEDPIALLDYLDANPWDSSAVIWTLNDETTPIYALQAEGPYASEIHARLRAIFRAQTEPGEEGNGKGKKKNEEAEETIRPIERVSIPGVLAGKVRLFTGQEVEVIYPERRGIYAWNTDQIVEAACAASDQDEEAVKEELRAFLDRIYYELRNMGQTLQERAMNYAATNAFNLTNVFSKANENSLFLDTIEVDTSPICRPDSECWDVKLVFFNPADQFNTARRVFRFTIDVSDIVPVLVGRIRDWAIR